MHHPPIPPTFSIVISLGYPSDALRRLLSAPQSKQQGRQEGREYSGCTSTHAPNLGGTIPARRRVLAFVGPHGKDFILNQGVLQFAYTSFEIVSEFRNFSERFGGQQPERNNHEKRSRLAVESSDIDFGGFKMFFFGIS